MYTLSRSLSIYDMRFVCINHVIYPPVNIMMLFELVLLELGVKFLKLNTICKKAYTVGHSIFPIFQISTRVCKPFAFITSECSVRTHCDQIKYVVTDSKFLSCSYLNLHFLFVCKSFVTLILYQI